MSFKVPEKYRVTDGGYGTSTKDGNNGLFEFYLGSQRTRAICSDGGGWEHCSVSLFGGKCPSWDQMCKIKDMFWGEEDCVIQFHPPKSDYVNNHVGCLHLWRSTDGETKRPPSWMVGLK